MAESDTDWLLEKLLDMADDEWPVPDITLNVGGTLVSGTPISASAGYLEYGERLGAHVARQLGQDPGLREIAAEWAEEAKNLYQQRMDARAALPEGAPPPEDDEDRRFYVNLKNARIYSPNQRPISVGFWRGRLSQVAGWHFGRVDEGRR